MQRLTGLDASFLYVETPLLVMHTLVALEFEPPSAGLSTLRHGLAQRLHLLPLLRRRLLEVPLRAYHPLWLEDPGFDLDAHLRALTLPAPGTPAQLDAALAELAGAPLDRRRPLWELCLIDGLQSGRVVALLKLHHAAADGAAIVNLVARALTLAPTELDPDAPVLAWAPDPLPAPRALLVSAVRERLAVLARLPALVHSTLRHTLELALHRRAARTSLPRPLLDTPRTSFNGSLSPHRSLATVALPLRELERVKSAFGVTLNDVVLALVAGSLRGYLAARHELPAKPLLAAVPLAFGQSADTQRLEGNVVSALLTSLATDVADPVERLRAIHASCAQAKEVQAMLGVGLMQRWAQHASPRLFRWVTGALSRPALAARLPVPVNVIVSNVRGSHEPLFAGTSPLRSVYFVGPLLEGVGLNVTVWSYLDKLHVTVHSCRALVPEPRVLAEGMRAALNQLVARSEIPIEARA